MKSSRPRRVLKYHLKIRGSIYLLLSVGRKMIPFPETVSDPKTILKKCRSVSKEGWTQVFILDDHCFDCAVCPSTSPFALGYLGKIVSRTTSYLEKDNRKGSELNCGPLSDTIMEGMVCVENSSFGLTLSDIDRSVSALSPATLNSNYKNVYFNFTTGSKRVANSLSCERQGNVAVMNGSLGSE